MLSKYLAEKDMLQRLVVEISKEVFASVLYRMSANYHLEKCLKCLCLQAKVERCQLKLFP